MTRGGPRHLPASHFFLAFLALFSRFSAIFSRRSRQSSSSQRLAFVRRAPEDAFAFLHQPVNAIAMLLFVIASVIHMTLGLQVVIEDYVHTEGSKLLLFLANKAFGWIIGVASVFAILRIAL